MMTFQQLNRLQRKCLIWVLLLLLAATLLWVFSIMNIIQGAWATVLNAVFTSLGTTFALLQWHTQALPGGSDTATLVTSDREFSQKQLTQGLVTKRKGAILVYTSRKWRGTTLYLVSGLQETDGPIKAVANVVECRIARKRQFLCHFPAVIPGHYTLVVPSKQRRVQVTICSGHLSEIDWQ